jgi:SAM-dependent methyltransferase
VRFTGERLVSDIPRLQNMIVEELARLNFIRPHVQGKIVLDAGCGLAHGAAFTADSGARWVLGVDISEQALVQAIAQHRRDNLALSVMDCAHLALAKEVFDVVYSLELIEHLEDVEGYLSQVCGVLKPEGIFYLSTPNKRFSSDRQGKASWPFHHREFALEELRSLLVTFFREVEIWGEGVPVYEGHPIRKITKSSLSRIKHILPARLRLWVSSSIRHWIKPRLEFEDVVFSRDNIEDLPTFVALCQHKLHP